MSDSNRFDYFEPQWCPGCGNFSILECLKGALVDSNLTAKDFIMVTGIGQAGKMGFSVKCNLYNGLHGRALPIACGIALANHKVKLITIAGDGDLYSEGGNHFIHNARRNLNITVLAGDNRVYGLTQGQASPTSGLGFTSKAQPQGVASRPVNPVLLAISSGATFVARVFSENKIALTALIEKALQHKGFSLIDILSPCVTFNHINNFKYFKDRVRPINDSHDVSAFDAALKLASYDREDYIPTGLIYQVERPVFTDYFGVLKEATIVEMTGRYNPDRAKPFFEQFK